MDWQRARQPEQIEQRRQAIIEAAAVLFESQDFEEVSLNAIARQAGMAKSNLYRYFETREEIFLQLYLEDAGTWVDRIEDRLRRLKGCGRPAKVAAALVDSMTENPRLMRLLSRTATVLERNLSAEIMADFKIRLRVFSERLQALIHGALPLVSQEQAAFFLRFFLAFCAGLWPMAHPSPVLDKVLERPDLASMRIDFRQDLEMGLRTLLEGFAATAVKRSDKDKI